jgi:hypothetical protein
MKEKPITFLTPPRNPNKRPCIAKNITFAVQKENEHWLRQLSKHKFLAH